MASSAPLERLRPLPDAPYVHVRRMRTARAGWQVRYVPRRGGVNVLHRRLSFEDAMTKGVAAARAHEVQIEVDP